jgi:hypothetical protein
MPDYPEWLQPGAIVRSRGGFHYRIEAINVKRLGLYGTWCRLLNVSHYKAKTPRWETMGYVAASYTPVPEVPDDEA